jgi:hypothetical protein
MSGTAPSAAPVLLAPLSVGAQKATTTTYSWLIHTCDVADAGTDANMYFYVSGTAGSTGWMLLDNPNRNDFERNQYDTFTTSNINVGTPTSFTVFNDRSGNKPGWALCSLSLGSSRVFDNGQVNWVDDVYGWTRTFSFNIGLYQQS